MLPAGSALGLVTRLQPPPLAPAAASNDRSATAEAPAGLDDQTIVFGGTEGGGGPLLPSSSSLVPSPPRASPGLEPASDVAAASQHRLAQSLGQLHSKWEAEHEERLSYQKEAEARDALLKTEVGQLRAEMVRLREEAERRGAQDAKEVESLRAQLRDEKQAREQQFIMTQAAASAEHSRLHEEECRTTHSARPTPCTPPRCTADSVHRVWHRRSSARAGSRSWRRRARR